MLLRILIAAFSFSMSLGMTAQAAPKDQKEDLLVKLTPDSVYSAEVYNQLQSRGVKIEHVTDQWIRIQGSKTALSAETLQKLSENPSVQHIQPNYRVHLLEDYSIHDPLRREALNKMLARQPKVLKDKKYTDNPEIPNAPQQPSGADPLASHQWGMIDIGVSEAWKVTKGSPEMIVAVIDTGVDYTHEDLLPNLWRNTKEIANNGIDDDHNGYVDDVIGWDFVSNDNKPYDLAVEPIQLLKGGNPGHGTHCAGNVAARSDNNLGVAGVAPNVKIMALRFISEKGQGTTADAIKAIHYAVDNGAKVMSNSWGSEGEDPADGAENQALRDAVQYSMDHGVLFIAAAGNGHQGVGYNNDTDPKPSYPATYPHLNIVSVAAIDAADKLGTFSNWGPKTVHIAAPGVKVYSTTVGSLYSDVVLDKFGFYVTWDGTSMSTPHVAGAAALYWSAHPQKSWQDVKAALIATAKKIPAVQGKVVSEGKLDVKALLNY
jgi:subtilisin family serine protease